MPWPSAGNAGGGFVRLPTAPVEAVPKLTQPAFHDAPTPLQHSVGVPSQLHIHIHLPTLKKPPKPF